MPKTAGALEPSLDFGILFVVAQPSYETLSRGGVGYANHGTAVVALIQEGTIEEGAPP